MAESDEKIDTIEIPESLARLLMAEDDDFKDARMAGTARELARASLRVLVAAHHLEAEQSNGSEPAAAKDRDPILAHHAIVNEARAAGEPAKVKRFMSEKAKKAISVRMRRYWKQKRAAAKAAAK